MSYSITDCCFPVCGLLLEVGGQVDDLDGVEGALLHTDAAPDAQVLASKGKQTCVSKQTL